MSQDLYSSRVLELAADIPLVGLLRSPDGRSHRVSRLCGSEIDVDICLQDGQVTKAGIEPKACALGQASASILMRNIVGASAAEIRAARDAFKAMLKEQGPAPTGRFWELRYLEAVRDYAPRHTSALLAFDAAVEAVERALAKQSAAGEI
ncbi:MAG: iron-sulfur cluster assembly scaffold protein [Hyphomonadaceae bacterium]|jgi:NifU-like protein involved in Fe-S cluster formation|nr:iron-sulfur cluster assembly scaffold protein [Hyphomonadaceae bacterium]